MQTSVTWMVRGILTSVLAVGFCSTQSLAQESFNFSDSNPASAANESNDTAVTQNLGDVLPGSQPAPSGVVSNLSDAPAVPVKQGSQVAPPFAVPRTGGQATQDAFSKTDPFSKTESSSSLPNSLPNKFVPPAFPAAASAQQKGTNAIPAIDMNMLRRQLEPPADAHVPANPSSETALQESADQTGPMNVLSPNRLAPTDSQPVIQQFTDRQSQETPSNIEPTESAESFLTGRMQTPPSQPPSQPQFDTPQFGTPKFGTPKFGSTQNETAQFESPAVQTPRFETPSFEKPSFKKPSFEKPSFESAPPVQLQPRFEQFQQAAPRVAEIPTRAVPSTVPTGVQPISTSILAPRGRGKTVASTTFNSPVEPNNSEKQNGTTGKLADAKRLIANYDVSNTSSPLPGVPASMLEMLQKTPTNRRPQMIHQYWETFHDWASFQNQENYLAWLNQIPRASNQAENILLHTAKSNARNRMLAAEIKLGQSQSKLLEFVSATDPDQSLMLPLDQPLISNYKTHYQWYNSRQMIPSSLKGIDQMLPKTLTLITNRAETVRNAQSATKQTQAALSSGQTNIAAVLEAGRLWQESLQGFVKSVVTYNQAIGEYAMTISQNQRPPEQIVSMLIPVSKMSSKVRTAPAGQTANQNPAIQNNPYAAQQNAATQQLQQPQAQVGSRATGSQAIGPNAGAYRGGARSAANNQLQPQGVTGSRTAQPQDFVQPSGIASPTGNARARQGARESLGDTPATGGGFAPPQPFPSGQRQPASNRPTSRPTNRTTSSDNSFGGGSFPR